MKADELYALKDKLDEAYQPQIPVGEFLGFVWPPSETGWICNRIRGRHMAFLAMGADDGEPTRARPDFVGIYSTPTFAAALRKKLQAEAK